MLKYVLHENIEQFLFSRTSLTFAEMRAWQQSFWHRREYIICYHFEYTAGQSDMQGLKCWKSIFEKENTWMRQDGSITYSAVLSNTSSFYSLECAKTHNIHICFHIPWWVWYPLLYCLPLREDLQITYAFHCGGDNIVSVNVLCPKRPESGKKPASAGLCCSLHWANQLVGMWCAEKGSWENQNWQLQNEYEY